MDRPEKEIIQLIPDATTRQRKNPYSDREYMYGVDNPEFHEKLKSDSWLIVDISLVISIFLGSGLAICVWYALKFLFPGK